MSNTTRLEKFMNHYSNVKKYPNSQDASNEAKRGQHILKVTPLNESDDFYILHSFSNAIRKTLYTGAIIGMWNELTVMGIPKGKNK